MTDHNAMTQNPYPSLRHLGGSIYEVRVNDKLIGRVGPDPRSRTSAPLWAAWRQNPDGYLGPLGGPWNHPTRKAALVHLLRVTGNAT